jgi:hypothetical protein
MKAIEASITHLNHTKRFTHFRHRTFLATKRNLLAGSR